MCLPYSYPNAIENAKAVSTTSTPSTVNEFPSVTFTEPLISTEPLLVILTSLPVIDVPNVTVSLTVKLVNSATSTVISPINEPLNEPVYEPVNEPLNSAYAEGACVIEPEKLGWSILI